MDPLLHIVSIVNHSSLLLPPQIQLEPLFVVTSIMPPSPDETLVHDSDQTTALTAVTQVGLQPQADQQPSSTARGRITLVGAGPGDPDLLTVKAYRIIQEAELVVSDNLVPKPILSLVRGELFVALKKSEGRADQSQDELMNVALEGAKRGRRVIRLKNGDPFVYGRGGEEVLFFRKHGFEVDVIPGISSCLAAPLSGLVPITHRGVADQFLVATGQGKNGSIPEIPPYAHHRTTVFLMSVARMADLARDLVAHGYPENCPVAVVEKATFPDQRVLRGTLATIADISQTEKIQSPSTIIIGNSVNALVAEQ